MVSFYGTVYKSSRYDLIIPSTSCESGAEREKRRAVVFASGKTGKSGHPRREHHQPKREFSSVFCGIISFFYI